MIRIGFLSTAHTHSKGFLADVAKRDNCRLQVIWDDMPERGQRFASEYKAEFSTDLQSTVRRDDIDGFIICAENTRHLRLLEAAIPVGKPIFCEKPFTTTTAEAMKALSLIARHKTIVHMGYMLPFSDGMQGIQSVLHQGKLGKVTHARFRNAHHAAYGRWFDSKEVAWFHDPALAGGGAFMDMGTHAVHLVRSLFGPARRAFARIDNVSKIYPRVDDTGIALIEFMSGVLCTVEASWVQTGGPGGIEITGSEGTLYSDPAKGYVTSAPGKEAQVVAKGQARPSRVDRLVSAIQGTIARDELDADLACAADAVAVMEACYKSNSTGAWVDVPKLG